MSIVKHQIVYNPLCFTAFSICNVICRASKYIFSIVINQLQNISEPTKIHFKA